MCSYLKKYVTIMSYLTGVSDELLIRIYSKDNNDLLIELRGNTSATLIRTLSIMRTQAIKHYRAFSPSLYTPSQLKTLESAGLSLPESCSVNECIIYLNRAIYNHIAGCRSLFPSDISWDNISDLFIIKGCIRNVLGAGAVIEKEVKKYDDNRNLYPFQVYVHWEPYDCGNMFDNDRKLYHILKSVYTESAAKPKAPGKPKSDPYTVMHDFVSKTSSYTVIAVDCENTNAYKLMSFLKGLPAPIAEKIFKIKLFTDAKIPAEWQVFNKQCGFPTELYPAKRVLDHKSTVDMLLATEVSREYFAGKTESFIIVSSDSDYLPVITALNNAHFLMLIEDGHCSEKTKNMLEVAGAVYCSLDDFPAADVSDFKNAVLLYCLKERLDLFNTSGVLTALNYNDLVNSITDQCRITLTNEERRDFVNKYMLTLRLYIGDDDNYYIGVPA